MIRRSTKFLLKLLGVAATLIVLVLAAGAYRLASGPVTLSFLSPYIESAVGTPVPGYRLAFDDTILTWSDWRRTLDIRVRGVRILDDGGQVVAAVPEVSVGLSGWAMLRGILAPTRLELIAPRALLVRRAQGGFVLGFDGQAEPAPDQADSGLDPASRDLLFALAKRVLDPPDSEQSMGFLRQISIRDADLTIFDGPTGTTWRAPGANFNLRRGPDGITGDFMANLLVDGRTWKTRATGVYDNQTRTASIKMRFDGVEPAVIARQAGLDGGFTLDGFALEGSLSADFLIEDSVARMASQIQFEIKAGAGSLALPGQLQGPINFDHLTFRGGVDWDQRRVILDSASGRVGATVVTASGKASFGEAGSGLGPAIDLDATVKDLPVNDLAAYWPVLRKPNGRNWVTTNLRDGMITAANLRARIPMGGYDGGLLPAEALTVSFEFKDLFLRYMKFLPPMTGLSGTGVLTPEQLSVEAGGGRIGSLRVDEGGIVIKGLSALKQTADIEFTVAGSSAEVLAAIDNPPLNYPTKMGIAPQTVGGMSASRLRIHMPLRPKVDLKEIQFAVASNMIGVVLPTFVEGLAFTDGSLLLKSNNAGLEVEGEVALNGVPLDFSWTRNFLLREGINGKFMFAGTVDGAGREALNLPTGDSLEGPVTGVLELETSGKVIVAGQGYLDLEDAAVAVAAISWRKPVGEPGNITYRFRPQPGNGLVFDNFEVAAGDLTAQGQIDFDSDLRLTRIDLGRLQYGASDLSLAMTWSEEKGYSVVAGGNSFDLRPVLADFYAGGDEQRDQPLEIKAKLGRLVLAGRRNLLNVSVEAFNTGEIWQRVKIDGRFQGGEIFSARVTPKRGVRTLRLMAGNAGDVGAGLDIFPGAKGGKLALEAVIDDQKPTRPAIGRLVADDFRLVDMPLVTKVLTVASLTGIADLVTGEGISIKRLDASFILDSEVLRLREATASGPAIGFTLEGSLDRINRLVDFSGTVVPAYTINSFLGKVPLVGGLLVPKKGEGVLAMTYRIDGDLDNPRVSVNPLSALAPGILRTLFSALDRGTGQRQASKENDKPSQAKTP